MDKTRARQWLRAVIRGLSLTWLALGLVLLASGAPEAPVKPHELYDGLLGFVLPGVMGLLLAHTLVKPLVPRRESPEPRGLPH